MTAVPNTTEGHFLMVADTKHGPIVSGFTNMDAAVTWGQMYYPHLNYTISCVVAVVRNREAV